MSLYKGHVLHSYIWKELLIDVKVIDKVEAIASADDAPIIVNGHLRWEWAPGIPIIDESNHNNNIELENDIVEINDNIRIQMSKK